MRTADPGAFDKPRARRILSGTTLLAMNFERTRPHGRNERH